MEVVSLILLLRYHPNLVLVFPVLTSIQLHSFVFFYYEIRDVFILYLTAFTTNNALNLLEECEFPINSKWEKLARNMGISLDDRHRLRIAISQGLSSETALEEAIDIFRRASIRPVTWNIFISRVKTVERLAATKMRRKLGIITSPSKRHYNYHYSFRLGCLSNFTGSINNEILIIN